MPLVSATSIMREMLYGNLGNHYRTMKKYDAAIQYFEKSMNIAVAQYGERNDEVAEIYRMQGRLFMDRMMFERALEDFHKMLNSEWFIATFLDYHSVPAVQPENPYFKSIIAANFNKGDALLAWFTNSRGMTILNLPLKITGRPTIKSS